MEAAYQVPDIMQCNSATIRVLLTTPCKKNPPSYHRLESFGREAEPISPCADLMLDGNIQKIARGCTAPAAETYQIPGALIRNQRYIGYIHESLYALPTQTSCGRPGSFPHPACQLCIGMLHQHLNMSVRPTEKWQKFTPTGQQQDGPDCCHFVLACSKTPTTATPSGASP